MFGLEGKEGRKEGRKGEGGSRGWGRVAFLLVIGGGRKLDGWDGPAVKHR
jgi:hypothetical protein